MNTEQKPEAPVTECACRKALEAIAVWPSSYPANANIERMREAARAALATPCPCAELREELGKAYESLGRSDRFERTQEEELLKLRADLATANERNNATMQRAVDCKSALGETQRQLAAANERGERAERTRNLAQAASVRDLEAKRETERQRDRARRELREVVASSHRALLEITEFSSGWRHGQEGVCLLHIDDLARAQISALAAIIARFDVAHGDGTL